MYFEMFYEKIKYHYFYETYMCVIGKGHSISELMLIDMICIGTNISTIHFYKRVELFEFNEVQ